MQNQIIVETKADDLRTNRLQQLTEAPPPARAKSGGKRGVPDPYFLHSRC